MKEVQFFFARHAFRQSKRSNSATVFSVFLFSSYYEEGVIPVL